MRAALQFLMRHMVKRAVMRSPIKRALGLVDLERAQAMIYKLVVNGLLEVPSTGKPGETQHATMNEGLAVLSSFFFIVLMNELQIHSLFSNFALLKYVLNFVGRRIDRKSVV